MQIEITPAGERPARVAILTTYYAPVIGGAESSAARLASYLTQRGHEVMVITKRTSVDHPEHDCVDGISVWRRPPIGPRKAFGKWAWLPWAATALSAAKDRYDVVVVVDQRAAELAAIWARLRHGVPLVYHPQVDGTLNGRHPLKRGTKAMIHRWLSWPIRQANRCADAIACLSGAIIAEGRELGIPADRLHYLPNAIDTSRFRPLRAPARLAARQAFGVGADTVAYSFVGRLSREKGVRELLQAWHQAGVPNAHLLVGGPDMQDHPWNEGPWARDFVREHGLSTTVTFLGSLTPDDVARVHGAADVAVLPSHFEAQGLAAVEAMATGRPIIASDVGGVPEFVVHEHNGLLVPPHDVPALAAAMRRMAESPALRDQWGAEARTTALTFAEDVVLERYAQLIDLLAFGHPPRPKSARGRLASVMLVHPEWFNGPLW